MTNVMDGEGLPVPVPDPYTQPYWDGTANGQLLVQRCTGCARWIWQPLPMCPRCHDVPTWQQVDGAGTVASWVVPHPPVLPALVDVAPYVVLLVELTEGIRMTGNLVDPSGKLVRAMPGQAPAGLQLEAPVSLRWRQQRGWTLPCWTLNGPDAGSSR